MSADRELDVVIVSEPEGGYSMFVPELPSVATQGEMIEEASATSREAIECHLEARCTRMAFHPRCTVTA